MASNQSIKLLSSSTTITMHTPNLSRIPSMNALTSSAELTCVIATLVINCAILHILFMGHFAPVGLMISPALLMSAEIIANGFSSSQE